MTKEGDASLVHHLVVEVKVSAVHDTDGFETVVLEGHCQGTAMNHIMNGEVARLQDDVKHVFERPGGVAGLVLNAEHQKRNTGGRVSSLLSILDLVFDEPILFLFLVELVPVELDVKQEDILREVLNEVDESVGSYLVQALGREGNGVLLFFLYTAQFAAPQLELIE